MRPVVKLAAIAACALFARSGQCCESRSSFDAELDDNTQINLAISQEIAPRGYVRQSKRVWGASDRKCVVRSVVLIANGKPIQFPHGSFEDVESLHIGPSFAVKPVVTGTREQFEIRLSGGDGGEGYKVVFQIKDGKLRSRQLFGLGSDGAWARQANAKF